VLPIGEVWRETIGGECPARGDMLRLTPARHRTDGFFVAVLERRGTAGAPAEEEEEQDDDG
jgi:16S rRNA (cytosine967-C5)-methyltransferase